MWVKAVPELHHLSMETLDLGSIGRRFMATNGNTEVTSGGASRWFGKGSGLIST